MALELFQDRPFRDSRLSGDESDGTSRTLRRPLPASGLARLLRRACVTAGLLLFVFTALAATSYFSALRHLPQRPEVLLTHGQLRFVTNADGTIGANCRCGLHVNLEEVPQHFIDALLVVEDRRFFKHNGIDLLGSLRATLATLAGHLQGGSTITQQLVKNRILEPGDNILERLYRKYLEAGLAWALENRFSKERILESYINTVDFGTAGQELAFGIEAAARKYFAKRAKELNLYESAVLVGALNAPAHYDWLRNPDAAHARARVVLGQMVKTGAIAEAEAAEALAAKAAPGRRSPIRLETRYLAAWIAHEVESAMPEGLPQNPGSLKILITLDTRAQLYAERLAIQTALDEGKARSVGNAALVSMSPDGAIRAMAHGSLSGHGHFRRFVDTRRQPGSAFKPFIYLPALESGMSLDTPVLDQAEDGWPNNFNGIHLGLTDLRAAFAKSLNGAAVNVARVVGLEKIVAAAGRAGIASNLRTVPSLALGTSEVGQVELTAAYAAFANQGRRVEPYGVELVLDTWGTVLYEKQHTAGPEVFASEIVVGMRQLLRSAVTKGTGRAAAYSQTVFGKTGTSQDFRDAWFIGFTGDAVTSIWLGNDDNRPMRGVTGGSLPAEAFRRFNATIFEDRESGTHLSADLDTGRLPAFVGFLLSSVGVGLLFVFLSAVRVMACRLDTVTLSTLGLGLVVVAGL